MEGYLTLCENISNNKRTTHAAKNRNYDGTEKTTFKRNLVVFTLQKNAGVNCTLKKCHLKIFIILYEIEIVRFFYL